MLSTGFPPNGSISYSPNTTNVVITLGGTDLDEIKGLTVLGTEVNDTFISITNITIFDMSGNLIEPIVRIWLYKQLMLFVT